MLSAALETSSLPLLGVNSPLTTKLVTYYHAVKIRDMISTTSETISLNIHTSWSTFSQTRLLNNSLTIVSYLHGKEKIQYILLFYHLYNLVGHRFSLLYILVELIMVTFWTHTIAKNGYLCRRPIWLNKPEILRYTIPRSFGQLLGKLLRCPL